MRHTTDLGAIQGGLGLGIRNIHPKQSFLVRASLGAPIGWKGIANQ